jgi:putative phosphonate metabolism protein
MSARYAIYFSPAPGSPWWEFGSRWLGRDAQRGIDLPQPVLTQIDAAALRAITTAPRRYGFHATLKAPFSLSAGLSVGELQTRLQTLARSLAPLALGPLRATTLGAFVALVPTAPTDALAQLATACVTDLDDMRLTLTAADLARRNAERLDARGRELLQRYGYPHVLERFRLHFTLTGPVEPSVAQHVMQAVEDSVAQLNASTPLVLDRLCLFVEPAPGQPFRHLVDAELGA